MIRLLSVLLLLSPIYSFGAGVQPWEKQVLSIRTLALEAKEANIPEFDNNLAFIHGPESSGAVVLTFDDGPGPYTGAVLEILAKHKAKATFFMYGMYVDRNPGIARQVAGAGHEIGNHTYNHPDFCGRLSQSPRRLEILADELSKAERSITAATGRSPDLMRIPYNCHPGWVENGAKSLGYTVVRWSVDGGDWSKPGVDRIAEYYLAHAKPGAIMLLHDGGGDRSQTVQALELILTGLEKKGLKTITVSEMLSLAQAGLPDSAR